MTELPWLLRQLSGAALLLLLSGCSHDRDETPVPFDPSFLDENAQPCTDFYQYACGTWLAQHPKLPGYAVQRFENGDYRDDIYFQQLVEAMASSDPSLSNAQSYYASCLAVHQVTLGVSAELNQQLALVSAMTSPADLPLTLARLQKQNVSALLYVFPEIDPGNPARYVLNVWDSGWSLPTRASYADPALGTAYRAHMGALASAALSASANVTLDADAVFAFEASVATAGSDSTDPIASYNLTDTAALATELPNFDWNGYFTELGFGGVADVNLREANYLPGLATVLAAAPLDTIKQYLTWRVLEASASAVNQPLSDEEFHFHRTVVEGQEKQPTDDQFGCLLATRAAFGFVLARHFVENFVTPDVKPDATGLVDAVQAAMRANFAQTSWLDDATRSAALQKFELLLPKVGYPGVWPAEQLDTNLPSTYLGQLIRLRQDAQDLAAAELSATVDRTAFWASPEITNAFYSPERNDITIPVAVLQDPFFRAGGSAAFNFGTLGAVIGHELTHGFDSSGRHFDGIGTLSDWWTETAAAEFDRRAQCLVDQFNGYEVLPGVPVDGQRTLNENIADLGGVKLAYAAFEADKARGAGSQGFSAEQEFFLSYAQLWCSQVSDQAAAQLAAYDPHSPPKFRVNGVLRNVP
ncbi:MAG TPA: M13 family metallopeptidase, partial [Polyangiaceae bacterium]|nr:M13 family metallopeptidase [Polyangiaceae bacterium]